MILSSLETAFEGEVVSLKEAFMLETELLFEFQSRKDIYFIQNP